MVRAILPSYSGGCYEVYGVGEFCVYLVPCADLPGVPSVNYVVKIGKTEKLADGRPCASAVVKALCVHAISALT